MMSVSALGLLTNTVVVISYISGQKAANDASSVASFFSGLSMLIHLVFWAVAAGLFKQQNATNGVENDLWSWSCSTTADARAEAFKAVVNYDFLCKSNVSPHCFSSLFCGSNDYDTAHFLVHISCKCRSRDNLDYPIRPSYGKSPQQEEIETGSGCSWSINGAQVNGLDVL